MSMFSFLFAYSSMTIMQQIRYDQGQSCRPLAQNAVHHSNKRTRCCCVWCRHRSPPIKFDLRASTGRIKSVTSQWTSWCRHHIQFISTSSEEPVIVPVRALVAFYQRCWPMPIQSTIFPVDSQFRARRQSPSIKVDCWSTIRKVNSHPMSPWWNLALLSRVRQSASSRRNRNWTSQIFR